MKFLPLTVLWLLLFSCNDKNNAPAKTTNASTPIKIDSGITKKETANPYAATDISPVDIIYFPVDYPVRKMSDPATAAPVARVIYSRPHRQGRDIFGSLLKYGEPWRLGANEATEIEIFQPVTIQDKRVGRGRYILYAIPQQDKWTIIFNSNVFSWGLKQDPKNDVYRFQVPAEATPSTIEYFTMVFEPAATGANLLMAWDDVVARLPISL